MEVFIAEWLNLLLRWAHLVVGVGWIGTSFYFIALDLALRKREQMTPGVQGTAWLVHGGGFYHVEKYMVAPDNLPPDLKWYQWEAYLTWVTGFALLVVQFYWNAEAYLIDPSVMDLTPVQAIAISVVSLAAGWFIYDGICRSPLGRNTTALAVCLFVLIVLSAIAYTQIYSGRGALIHVGALVGTFMAVNVFGVIIPNQKKVTAALIAGETPDPEMGRIAKQRSLHNNYLTLPVLLMMVSNHYPLLTNHPHAWLLVALVLVMGAMVRHFINRHDAGDPMASFAWTLPAGGVALLAALVLTAPSGSLSTGPAVADEVALTITQTHCAACHGANPSHEAFDEAPKGIVLETTADLRRYAPLVLAQSVHTDAMPLGNETGMTDEDRARLGAWLNAQE
ncbi:MAG: urate hydroxylase PuuD [Pseudomonadota bacterium]